MFWRSQSTLGFVSECLFFIAQSSGKCHSKMSDPDCNALCVFFKNMAIRNVIVGWCKMPQCLKIPFRKRRSLPFQTFQYELRFEKAHLWFA